MELLLQRGQMIPNFALPNARGEQIKRAFFRGKHHLILAFLPPAGDDVSRAYLRVLADAYAAFRAAGGEVVAIIASTQDDVAALLQAMHFPFMVLADADKKQQPAFFPLRQKRVF